MLGRLKRVAKAFNLRHFIQRGGTIGSSSKGMQTVASTNNAPRKRWLRFALQALLRPRPVWRWVERGAWTTFFLLALFFLTVRHAVLPNVERYRSEIVAAATQGLGMRIEVNAIRADWRGLRPHIELNDLRVYDAQNHEALRIPSVTAVISLRSLLVRELRLQSLQVDGLRLQVRRDAQGRIIVAGIVLENTAADHGSLTDWVLAQREFRVSNAEIEWVDELRRAPALRLRDLNFRMTNAGDVHTLGLVARPPPALGSVLDVRAQLRGESLTTPDAWDGQFFVELGDTDLAAWGPWIDYPIKVRSGRGALRSWMTLVKGQPQRITADVALSNLATRLAPDLPELQLALVHGRVSGSQSDTLFELGARDLNFATESGVTLPPTSFLLKLSRATADVRGTSSLNASRVDFAPLTHVLEMLPVPKEARALLVAFAPQGALNDTQLQWQGTWPALDGYSLRTRFTDFGVAPSGGWPGFSGLSGSVEMNEKKGQLQLSSSGAQMDLAQVLVHPALVFETLNGQLQWTHLTSTDTPATTNPSTGESVQAPIQFDWSGVSFANADLSGSTEGRFVWSPSAPGQADFSVQLAHARIAAVPRYLPLAATEGLRQWITRAFVAGEASDVRLRLRGDLASFPFVDAKQSEFRVSAKIAQGVLDYTEGWPRIESIDADLQIDRDKLELVGRKGHVYGTTLSGVRVRLPRLGSPSMVLAITGQADGPTADALRYVRETALNRITNGVAESIEAVGQGQLRLNLELPLAEPAKSRLMGSFQVNANTLTVDRRLPPIERVAGRFEFTHLGFALRELRGHFLGGPATFTGGTQPQGGVQVVVRGDATAVGLRPLLEPAWRRFLNGAAPYTATVTARSRNDLRVALESNLRGVSINLPAPLNKAAADAWPMRIELSPQDGADRVLVSLPARGLNAEFLRRASAPNVTPIQRVGIGLNQAARLPERNGMLVAGQLPTLNLDTWLPIFSGPDGLGSTSASAEASEANIVNFDLRLGTFDLYNRRLNSATVRANVDPGGWKANIASTELTGELSYRNEGRGRLVARLSSMTPPAEINAPSTSSTSSASTYPAVDLVTERFIYRGKQYGRVEIFAQPEANQWRIERFANINPDSSLTGKGVWTLGSASRTAIDFSLDISDSGKFLERMGHPEAVRGGTAKLSGNVFWNADPLKLDYASLGGEVALQADNGQFLEIEPGIGKLIGLMSLQMLPRRIALDFRDVFSKGFAYDRMSATTHIEKGVLSTRDFRMRGVAAEVEMIGDINLARETQNLQVRVIPALGDSASTVLGFVNPIAGITTMLAQRILRNPLGQIFAYDYVVTGSWTDPRVEKAGTSATPLPPGKSSGQR